MTDWEWKRDHVKKGRDLFAKAYELRTPEQAIEWEIKAEGWWRVAKREVKARHPEDINLIEPVGVIPFISMRPENPLYTLAPANLTRGSTSEGSLANTPASRSAARFASLDKLDWPKPGRKTARKMKNLDKQISTAKHLRFMGKAASNLAAATLAVEEHGRGDRASEDAAIQHVRKNM